MKLWKEEYYCSALGAAGYHHRQVTLSRLFWAWRKQVEVGARQRREFQEVMSRHLPRLAAQMHIYVLNDAFEALKRASVDPKVLMHHAVISFPNLYYLLFAHHSLG